MNSETFLDVPDENDLHTIICRNCKNSWYTDKKLTGSDLRAEAANAGWGTDEGGRPLCPGCYVGLMCG